MRLIPPKSSLQRSYLDEFDGDAYG